MLDPFIRFDGAINLRDAGGRAAVGGRMRRGVLFRSGSLADLSDAAVDGLAELGIRTVFDLRSAEEIERSPSRVPASADYRHRPVEDPSRIAKLRAVWAVLVRRNRLAELLFEGYTRVMLDANAHIIGEMVTAAASAEAQPILIHCTAGKDRTGLTIALIQSIVGVPREAILSDYELSNQYTEQFKYKLKRDIAILRRFGLTEQQLRPLFIADPALLTRVFDYVDERYGSVEQYLIQQAGVSAETLVNLQKSLIEPSIP